MPVQRILWERLAHDLGFPTVTAWLRHWYLVKKKPIRQICRELGVSYRPVYNLLKDHGIPLRHRGSSHPRWVAPVPLDQLKEEFLRDGVLVVAERYGVGAETIYKTVKLTPRFRRTA
jgi:hypothetical protein